MEVKPVTDILRCFCKSWNSAGNHFGNHFCDECFGSCGGAFALVNPCYGSQNDVAIKIEISYSEASKETNIVLVCGGKEFNPFSALEDDETHLGITIIKQVASKYGHTFSEGKNTIEVRL